MAPESPSDFDLEIAHVLFMDIVGYSKLLVDEQRDLANELNRIVRESSQFKIAEAAGKLIRLPTGDGMALAFFTNPEAPLKCAIEISEGAKGRPGLELRMGIHSGPVSAVTDVNDRSNVAGAGINIAQRVMDCGDAGHIFLSKRVAEDLAQYGRWRSDLHELGEIEVKHGAKVGVVNFYTAVVGNAAVPGKVAIARQEQARASKGADERSRAKRRLVRSALLFGAALVIGIGIFSYRELRKARTSAALSAVSAPEKSIAVLPFENLSDEKENAFFADGIQDDLLTSLSKIGDLKVISRTSVSQYRGAGAARNLRDIAQALAVENILEGSVRRVGNRVLVNVQLIDARHDRHLWAERYDRTIADSIGLQAELATEIANALRAKLAPEEKARLEAPPTKNPEAYVLYLKAQERYRIAASREDGIAADQLYAQAIALDPTFALAIARASIVNSKMYQVGRDPARKVRARALAEEALRMAPGLSESHLALALCFYRIDRDYAAALQELSKAAATSPNAAEILDFTGGIYLRQGHWREALAHFLKAQEFDPRNPYADKQDRDIANMYMALRDWPAAAAAFRRQLQISPENEPYSIRAQIGLSWAEICRTGDPAAGKAVISKIPVGIDPEGIVTLARWDISMLERDFATAEKILAEFPSEEFSPPMRTPKSYFQGLTALARGDASLAQTLFEKARPSYELGVQNHPDDARFLSRLGMLYAHLGRKEEAIRAARRAAELVPESKDANEGIAYANQLAGVYARTGETDQAIPLIEQLLTKPDGLALVDLRLRWEWDPLRNDPRFKKILAGPEPKTIY